LKTKYGDVVHTIKKDNGYWLQIKGGYLIEVPEENFTKISNDLREFIAKQL